MYWRCPACEQLYHGDTTRCPYHDIALEAAPDPWTGKVLDRRYELLEQIGEGGMGTVYRARHVTVRREVAVKVLSGEYASDTIRAKRFVREARASNLLRHEAVIDVHDVGESDGALYLVMDLLRGESLAARIARGPCAPEEVAAWAAPVTSALARAHALGVIHRDVKPANIFLSEEGGRTRVKVLDFGVAHVRDETPLTRVNELIGTHEYLAPELFLRLPCSPASDLYALGVTLFEALSGRLPFEGPRLLAGQRRLQEPAPDLRSLEPTTPSCLAELVATLLERDPARRPPDATAVLDALRRGLPGATAARATSAPLAALRTRESALRGALPSPEDALALAALARNLDDLLALEAESERLTGEVARAEARGREALAALSKELAAVGDAQERVELEIGRALRDEAPLRARAAETTEALAQAWAAVQRALGDAWHLTPSSLDAMRTLGARAEACAAARDAHEAALAARARREAESAALEARGVALQEQVATVYDEVQREVARLLEVAEALGAEAARHRRAFAEGADRLEARLDG